MPTVSQIKQRLSPNDDIIPISAEEAARLRQTYPGIPEEYLSFLHDVGYGEVANIRLYEGPIGVGDVYPHKSKTLSHIVLFGDDLLGYCFGFDIPSGFAVVELDPRGEVRDRREREFLMLVERYL
jgi:hypothetical protein